MEKLTRQNITEYISQITKNIESFPEMKVDYKKRGLSSPFGEIKYYEKEIFDLINKGEQYGKWLTKAWIKEGACLLSDEDVIESAINYQEGANESSDGILYDFLEYYLLWKKLDRLLVEAKRKEGTDKITDFVEACAPFNKKTKYEKIDYRNYQDIINLLKRYGDIEDVLKGYESFHIDMGKLIENIYSVYKHAESAFSEVYLKYQSMPFNGKAYLESELQDAYNLLDRIYGIIFHEYCHNRFSIKDVVDRLSKEQVNEQYQNMVLNKYSKILYYYFLFDFNEKSYGDSYRPANTKNKIEEIPDHKSETKNKIEVIDEQNLKKYFKKEYANPNKLENKLSYFNLLCIYLKSEDINGNGQRIANIAVAIWDSKLLESREEKDFKSWYNIFRKSLGLEEDNTSYYKPGRARDRIRDIMENLKILGIEIKEKS